jgi:cytochrome c oxidase subunit II
MKLLTTRRQGLNMLVGSGLALLAALVARQVPAQPRRQIDLVAKRFSFTPSEVKIKVGEPIILAIKSMDFVHGISIPDLKIRSDLVPGRITRIELVASKPGKIEFVCDNFCGDGHEEMHGHFIVSA